MGKIRIKALGDEKAEKKQQLEARQRAEAKRAEKKAEKTEDTSVVEEVKTIKQEEQPVKAAKKSVKKAHTKIHSSGYQKTAELVDKKKVYTFDEALTLLKQLQRAKFDESVELHVNTQSQGVTVNTVLPHGTGKKIRVAIADEAIIAKIEKGQIDFDVLVAQPQMMPKLAKVARILGPKGLMPNPKNGTVTPNPEEVAKKFENGQVQFKTEAKFPILHMTLGKISFGEDKLVDNAKAIAAALPATQVKDATLKLTMSPAIKVDYSSIQV